MLLRKIKNLVHPVRRLGVKKLVQPKYLKIFLMVLVLLGIFAAMYIQTAHPVLAQVPPAPAPAPAAPAPSSWNPMTWIPLAIGVMVQLGITLIGQLLDTIIYILIKYVIFYNDFIYTSIVMTGWEIVRDVANMFFVLILLFVAIATILSIENYGLRRFLPRIVLMAILINFSKVIAGIIIDFAQIITWTFASVINETGIQNIYFSFGLPNLFSISQATSITPITDWPIVTGLIFGFILLLIAFIIILVYTLILILRIVALWILIILSPMAYLLNAWPGGYLQKYAHQWWDEFTKYVVVAPVLMFFLWLALTASGTDIQLNVPGAGVPGAPSAAITKIATIQDLVRFIVTACLLIVGLSAAQKSGVAGAGFAGSAMSRMRRTAQWAGRKFTGYGWVADRAKAYMDVRRSEKARRARTFSEGLAGGVDKIKQTVGGTVGGGFRTAAGWTASTIGGKIPIVKNWVGNEKKAKQARAAAEESRKKLDILTKDHEKQGTVQIEGKGHYTYDKTTERWRKSDEAGKVETTTDANGMSVPIEEHTSEEFAKSFVKPTTDKYNDEIKKESDKAEKNEKRQRRIDGIISNKFTIAALYAGALSVGGHLGGALALGSYGAALNRKQVRNWGKDEINSASSYFTREVDTKRNEVKNDNPDELRRKTDDATLDDFTRVAAILEGIRQGIFSLTEVERHKATVERLSGKDKKMMNRFEAEVQNKYAGATKEFQVWKDPKKSAEERKDARRAITDRYADRTYTLKDQDIKTIEMGVPMAADAMKGSEFISQYKSSSMAQQKAIERGLEAADESYKKAKNALADIKDVNIAFKLQIDENKKITGGNREGFENYLKGMSVDDVRGIINGDPKRLDKFVKALDALSNTDKVEVQSYFGAQVNKILSKTKGPGKNIREGLGLDDIGWKPTGGASGTATPGATPPPAGLTDADIKKRAADIKGSKTKKYSPPPIAEVNIKIDAKIEEARSGKKPLKTSGMGVIDREAYRKEVMKELENEFYRKEAEKELKEEMKLKETKEEEEEEEEEEEREIF